MLIIVFLVCCVFSIISVIVSSSGKEPEPKPEPTPKPAPAPEPVPEPEPEEKPEISFSTSAALTADREIVAPQVKAGRIPVDCVLGDWYNDGADTCNSTGKQKQKRDVKTAERDGGTCDDPKERTINCNVDCKVSGWGNWSACSVSCGGGTQSRSRTVTQRKWNNGAACPNLLESQSCNTQGCYSTRTESTVRTAASDGSGSDRLRDLDFLDCGDDAINGFKLERDGNEIYYKYTCLEGVNSSSSPTLVTSQESHGSHNKVYLDRLHPDCGAKPISKFKYMYGEASFNNDKGWYAGNCSDLSHNGNCRDVYTDWNEEAKHKVVYLDRHNLQCDSNEAMTDFKYERDGGGKMRYKYRCCDMPSPR